MPLVQFPLRTGLAEGDDPKGLPPGTLTYLENCTWNKAGRVEKRNGNTGLTKSTFSGGTLSGGTCVFARGSAPCMVGGLAANEYSAAGAKWQAGDYVTAPTVTWKTTVDSSVGVTDSDIAWSTLGYYVIAWVDQLGAIYVKVVDSSTGAVAMTETKVSSATATNPRLCIVGSRAVLVYVLSGGPTIVAVSVSLTSMSVDSEQTLRSDTTGGPLDIVTTGSNVTIAYEWTGAAPKIKLYSYSVSGFGPTTYTQVQAGTINQVAAGILSMSIDGAAGESLYLAYSVPGALRSAIADANTLVETIAPSNLVAGAFQGPIAVCRTSSTTAMIVYHIARRVVSCTINSGGGVNIKATTYNAGLASKPVYNATTGITYFALGPVPSSTSVYYATSGQTLFLVEAPANTGVYGSGTPHKIVGTIAPRTCTITPQGSSLWRGVAGPNNSSAWLLSSDPSGLSGTGFSRMGMMLTEMTPSGSPTRAVSALGLNIINGSSVLFYDGVRCQEYGFYGPSTRVSGVTSGVGGGILAGTYLYSVVPVYTDATGIRHRGPPSTPISITTVGTTSSNTLTIDTFALDSKESLTVASKPVYFEVYRTTVNGSILYLLTVTTSIVKNTPNAATVTYLDIYPDSSVGGGSATLSSQRILYTTGGILEDQAPPSSIFVHVHRDRVWLISGDKRTVYFSKNFSEDPQYAPGFNDLLTLRFDEDLVALATLDEKLVVFGTNSIWVVAGDGPPASGLNSDLFVQRTQSDVGCSSAKSVVSSASGVFFLCSRGLYLLDRTLQTSWIGRPIKDKLASYPTVTSGTLVAKYNQVRFALSNGTTGVSVVFDYVTGQWSTFAYYDTATSTANVPVQDAAVINGVYTWCTAGGKVYQETESSFLDDTRFVSMRFDVAPVSAMGPIGFQRVRHARILSEANTPCNLTLRLAFDYSASWAQSYTFTNTALATIGNPNVGMRVGSQNGASPRCAAIALSVADSAPTSGTSTGKGVSFSAVVFEIVPREGTQRRGRRSEA